MRNYNFIKDALIQRHETIDNYEYLEKYINFLIDYKLDITKYSERHHILPRSTFPEFQNDDWNLIELNYDDHKLVHLWIFKAINIRTYQRPLNWMMSYYKNHEEISNAAKKGWIKLKSNEEKYKKWRKSKSDSMKKLSSEEQSRRASIFWDNITDEEYLSFCGQMREYWTDERKLKKSNDMKNFYLDENEVEKKRIETKERWDSLDEKVRVNFREKMDLINKNEDKRKDAGNKIRDKWLDPEYLEKMRNRKTNPGTSHKIIYENGGEKTFETLKKMEKELCFSMHLIRKYRDTNMCISEKHLSKDNINLLKCKIETIKE